MLCDVHKTCVVSFCIVLDVFASCLFDCIDNITGKVWIPKVTQKVKSPEDEIQTEWDEALKMATEEELVDLAG